MGRAFVSGEDGLLPRAIIAGLRERGWVIVNDEMEAYKTWTPPPDILERVGAHSPRANEVNVLSKNTVERLAELEPDLIVHAAAMVGTDKCVLDERLAWKCNVETTFNMAWAARSAGARLVYLSSSAVYDPDGTRPYRVSVEEPRPRTIYGQTKLLGEPVCTHVAGRSSLILRPSFVYGGMRDTSSTFVRVAKAVVFDHEPVDVLLDDQYMKDFMHVDDFRDLVLGLIESDAYGTYNVVRGNPRRFGLVREILYDLLGRESVLDKMVWMPEEDYMEDHFAEGLPAWVAAGFTPSIDIEEGIPRVINELWAAKRDAERSFGDIV